MNRLIIFDFNRTLFDPDAARLLPGAVDLLKVAQAKGYTLILLSQAVANRQQLIDQLGIAGYFREICLVTDKNERMFAQLEARYDADTAHSFVIGDRAQKELLLGYRRGWRTIWARSGRFAGELPRPGQEPEFTVSRLDQIPAIL